jgi:[acyl-carrier-protein] S-malonyltransferase
VGVVANVTAEVNQDPQYVKDLLVRQVTAPVRWEPSMQKLQALGCEAAIEIGPGKVLAGLLKRIAPGMSCVSVSDPVTMDEARRVWE